jgi:hypothetical protein
MEREGSSAEQDRGRRWQRGRGSFGIRFRAGVRLVCVVGEGGGG